MPGEEIKFEAKEWEEFTTGRRDNGKELKRKMRINHLMLHWLVSECHIEAVRSLSLDLGLDWGGYIDGDFDDQMETDDVDVELVELFDNLADKDEEFFRNDKEYHRVVIPVNNLKSMRPRRDIKLSILKGDIATSFELINGTYPTLFEKNHLIYFKLLHLQLIEMIRDHVVLKSRGEVSEQTERLFLANIMDFVKTKLSSLKIISNRNFIKELELTMVLLCYTDELANSYSTQTKPRYKIPIKLKKLFDKQQRIEIAKLVNKSILLDINNDDDINLIRYDDGVNFPSDHDLISKFNQLDNEKLVSLVKLWIWSENQLSQYNVKFPGINLDL